MNTENKNIKKKDNINQLSNEKRISLQKTLKTLDKLQINRFIKFPLNHPFNICEMNDDFEDYLKISLKEIFIDENIYEKFFSKDYRANLKIINFINEEFEFPNNYAFLSDILLKWIYSRFIINSNHFLLKELFELLEKICLSKDKIGKEFQSFEIDFFLAIFQEILKNFPSDQFLDKLPLLLKILKKNFNEQSKIANFLLIEYEKNTEEKIKNFFNFIISNFFIDNLSPNIRILFENEFNKEQISNSSSIIIDKSLVKILEKIFYGSPLAIKLEYLFKIQKILIHEKINHLNCNEILNLLFIKFNILFEERNTIDNPFLKFFLNSLLKILSNKELIISIKPKIIKPILESILKNLIEEDQNKKEFIKLLNDMAMKLLENINANLLYEILFELLISYRKISSTSKIVALICKCINKISRIIRNYSNSIDFKNLFKILHKYNETFNFCYNYDINDPGLKIIKIIIYEIYQIVGEDILKFYSSIEEKNEITIKKLEK